MTALLDWSECACPVRRYVPELARVPVQYIYEPWKAPIDVQERANCIIGKDYPAPMVNHLDAAARNKNNMKELRRILEKAPPHCCPSSEEEIRRFMWLNDDTESEVSTS
ncbi:Cryptochrome-1 [Papilio machaon]|uniref:Cryptochrome-1 n=1 Tax=Papilio machaon TaxID=76193 RepID=A0A194RNR2_PAPMA|nr:Cryptochrome-1 [Papilio machaon]